MPACLRARGRQAAGVPCHATQAPLCRRPAAVCGDLLSYIALALALAWLTDYQSSMPEPLACPHSLPLHCRCRPSNVTACGQAPPPPRPASPPPPPAPAPAPTPGPAVTAAPTGPNPSPPPPQLAVAPSPGPIEVRSGDGEPSPGGTQHLPPVYGQHSPPHVPGGYGQHQAPPPTYYIYNGALTC